LSAEDIKFLKMLKALDNPIRIKIVEFILNYKDGNDIILTPPKERLSVNTEDSHKDRILERSQVASVYKYERTPQEHGVHEVHE